MARNASEPSLDSQQHLKITPNLLIDYRIDPITNKKVTRVAYRIKITKNPAINWHQLNVLKLKITAVFDSTKLSNGCKLLCKPKATFIEKEKTLTWNVPSVKKTKMYLISQLSSRKLVRFTTTLTH